MMGGRHCLNLDVCMPPLADSGWGVPDLINKLNQEPLIL